MKPFFAWFLFVCLCSASYAQTCTGSLGDPIVKVDFGADPLNQFSTNTFQELTNYSYIKNHVEDGQYSIKNNMDGDHPGGWWRATDHTGDNGGYMMVVNASKEPGEFFRKKVTGLCPGTTYEFAAWVLNLLVGNGIKPNITFIIESASGTKTFDTGEIANGNPNWVQYGTFFRTAAISGDVTIIMKNNAPGGAGNDIALDDITFRACGPSLVSNFIASAAQFQNACEGDNVSYAMSATAGSGYADPAYQWQMNSGNGWNDIPGANTLSYTATFTGAMPGTYNYRVATGERSSFGSINCRVNSNQLSVIINKPPSNAVAGPATFCEGDPISFECAYGDTYSWTGPNGFTDNHQTVFISKSTLANGGTYNVTIKRNGCVVNTSHKIVIIPKIKANAGADTVLCFGTQGQLHATGGLKYQWAPVEGLSDPNIANPVVNISTNMTYSVKVTGANDCFAMDTVNVNVTHPVTANAGPDRIIDEGDTIHLRGIATGVSYYWSPATSLSDANSLTPIADPIKDITYILYTTSGDPCNYTATDQVSIRVYNKVIIPNTFTPNNDGVNDTWNITALNTYPNATLQIFSRKGDLLYQTRGYKSPWDGSYNGNPLPVGVYYYKMDLGIGRPPKAGWVSIIR